MNTYSHFLLTALGREQIKRRGIAVHTRGALLGSIMPDVPLVVLTAMYIIYYRFIDPIPATEHIFSSRYDNLYFAHPGWIILHNMFHAPLMVAALAALGWYGMRARKSWGTALFWFALACGFHSLIDILTHHNDGPLLLFPFNWEYRLITPISYWDTEHYANIVGPLEHLMCLSILTYFFTGWLRRKMAHRRTLDQSDTTH